MSKYMNENYYNFKLTQMIQEGEEILWQGKPDKRCFILESIFNPFLPFAFIWFLFDLSFIILMLNASEFTFNGDPISAEENMQIAIPFFAVHMIPVWIYLSGVIFSFKRHSNTEFIITNKAVYISSGVWECRYYRKTFDKLPEIQLRQGYFDKILHVGDIVISRFRNGRTISEYAITDIYDFMEVYNLLSKLKHEAKEKIEQQKNETLAKPDDNTKGYRHIDIEE